MTVSPELQQLARDWLAAADRLGWGMDGPEGAEQVRDAIRSLLDSADEPALRAAHARADAAPLGDRPLDALWAAAALLTRGALVADGHERPLAERRAAIRGWLHLAEP